MAESERTLTSPPPHINLTQRPYNASSVKRFQEMKQTSGVPRATAMIVSQVRSEFFE